MKALRELGADCGGEKGRRWIMFGAYAYNKNVTMKHPNAITIPFVDLLGLRDELMKGIVGAYWRRSFKERRNRLGLCFTYYREFMNINFITIDDGDENVCNDRDLCFTTILRYSKFRHFPSLGDRTVTRDG